MNRRERVLAALRHEEADGIPLDLGGTAVTGVHVSCVAALREHYGLEKRPVKVHEPYQMLGLIDEDLKQAMGIDVEGVYPYKTMFGFPNTDWKEWRLPGGLEVLVPRLFMTTVDDAGNTLIYPEGDPAAPPSGRMPKDGFFFDSIIRQDPIDEENLDPEDNFEEFGPISGEELDHVRRSVRDAAASGGAVVATFSGTAFGDIALVPAPFLKHPKGIRDVAEWYMSTRSRRSYVHRIFSKQCEFALQNLQKIHQAVGDAVDVVFTCGTDFGTQTSAFCSVETFRELYFPSPHHVAHVQAFLRVRGPVHSVADRVRIRHPQPGAVLGGRNESRGSKGDVRRQAGVLGGRGRYPEGAPLRCAAGGSRAGSGALQRVFSRRWICLQLYSQHPGPNAGRKHRRHGRRRSRVQRTSQRYIATKVRDKKSVNRQDLKDRKENGRQERLDFGRPVARPRILRGLRGLCGSKTGHDLCRHV